MGNMLLNVVAFAFMQGLNGALESLVSRAYGAKQFELCGTYFNRGQFLCSVLMVPIVVIFANSETILVALEQEPGIAYVASKYCCLLIPGLWAMGMFDSSRKFLSAQFLNTIPLYVALSL
jgi:MATE family multidrug resistance protein